MTKEQAIEKAKEQYSEIWDCDINHPKYEDTVEEIVTGVIRLIMQPTSDDCVSRQAVLDLAIDYGTNSATFLIPVCSVKNLPSVTPTHGTCKDCKHCCFITGTKNRVCEKHGCMQVSNNWYCADFEK